MSHPRPRRRLDSPPDGPRIVAFSRSTLGFGHWLSETAEAEYWLSRPANPWQIVYLHDPTPCGPNCDCPF